MTPHLSTVLLTPNSHNDTIGAYQGLLEINVNADKKQINDC